MKIRVGFGYDVHQFTDDRPLYLGGIRIEHTRGLLGHSDADVLIHAMCDAILGAANLRDIGFHFPDNDPQYKGIDSKMLLRKVFQLIDDRGYRIGNIDATICMQQPKIASYIPHMIDTLCRILETEHENISIKATTTERLGFVGREEGVSAYATVLLEKEEII